MQWPFLLCPRLVKLGTDADNKEAPTVNTIPVRNGAAAPRKAMANMVGQQNTAKIKIRVVDQHALFAERALRAGASGYLMKHAPNEELLTAIREIVRGEIYVSRKIAMLAFQKLLETPRENGHQCRCNHASIESLSDREIHVFQLLGSGLGTRKIAEALNLSAKTIESHRENIKRKLGLHSGVELTGLATAWVTENFLSSQ